MFASLDYFPLSQCLHAQKGLKPTLHGQGMCSDWGAYGLAEVHVLDIKVTYNKVKH